MIPNDREDNLLEIVLIVINEYCQHIDVCGGCVFRKEDGNCFADDIHMKMEQ